MALKPYTSLTSLLIKMVFPCFNYKFGHCEDHKPIFLLIHSHVTAVLWCTERWFQWIFQKGQFSSFPIFFPGTDLTQQTPFSQLGSYLRWVIKYFFFLELSTSHRILYMQPNETMAYISVCFHSTCWSLAYTFIFPVKTLHFMLEKTNNSKSDKTLVSSVLPPNSFTAIYKINSGTTTAQKTRFQNLK